jgi:glycyl-tRNA synthetase beta chain
VSNILEKKTRSSLSINVTLLSEPAEIKLYAQLASLGTDLSRMFETNDYRAALELLSTLEQPIDEFFDSVMVMSQDIEVQANRILLLQELRHLFLRIADISLLN